MDRTMKIKIAVGVAAAIAVAGGGAAAFAASEPWSPKEESQAVIDDAAEQLGVQPGELADALEQALENRVDAAVAAGRLTEEQGKALKERLASGDAPLIFGGLGHHGLGHHGHLGNLDAAAGYLGLTETELRERLSGGDTLAEIAKAEGKTVDDLVQVLVQAASTKLDQAVGDGRLTQAQANGIKGDLRERIAALVNGELRGRGLGFRRGFEGFERGHDPFFGPRG